MNSFCVELIVLQFLLCNSAVIIYIWSEMYLSFNTI